MTEITLTLLWNDGKEIDKEFSGEKAHLEAQNYINENRENLKAWYPTVNGRIPQHVTWDMAVSQQREKYETHN